MGNILLITEDEITIDVVRGFAAQKEHRIETVFNEFEAKKALVLQKPDVVLLDLDVCKPPCYDAFKVVRTDPHARGLPFVFLSGPENYEAMKQVVVAGAEDFLRKPVNRLELQVKVHSAVLKNHSQELASSHRSHLAQNLNELEESLDAILSCWTHAMDGRTHETENHSEQVAQMAVAFARYYGVDPDALVHIRRGALLHDIGKIGMPDEILLKKGALNEDEWHTIHQHPTRALRMLEPIAALRQAVDIPYCHHEKWDGSGYPRGLQGEQIPLAARLFAIVDVWNALISERPFRPAWSADAAMNYILEQMGKHFDPRLVLSFWEFILNREKATSSKDPQRFASAAQVIAAYTQAAQKE